jgi:hypothetical protein
MAASWRATAIGPSTPPHASLTDALWIKAVQKLSEEDKRDIDFTRIDKLSILEDVLAAVEEENKFASRGGGSTRKATMKLLFVINWRKY